MSEPERRTSRAVPVAIAAIAALGAGLFWYLLSPSAAVGGHMAPARVGEVAPDFALESTEGGAWKLSEHRGHKVLLVFFRTHT